ncbi:hypothetical protein BB559_005872 [Furculomyces boomerangus]|uniref:Plectin/eS10 N-terminal domain-containing protein n=2 Tax=Furculomyces boomerangus TaxID=61424 RepID=A0A2T9Y698_9FUNG|nr:hypothetical protein BB559_005872 [Furculomyces boomerangus]
MDLSRVTLPTFVLEPRSFTERVTDFMTHPDILLGSVDIQDPIERFVSVAKYYMSGWHIHPKGVKKPYNPILGEFFRCEFDINESIKSYFVSEQVSHHPPISAFAYYCPDKGVYIEGDMRPKGRFLGNSVGVFLSGSSKIHLEKHKEDYVVTYPNMYSRGILFGKMVLELGEKASIGFFGGVYNQIIGKIKKLSTDETLYEIDGNWEEVMYIKKKEGNHYRHPEIFFDPSNESIVRPSVAPVDEQEENESRRLWKQTTKGILNFNMLIPKQNRKLIYESLFNEGVLVAEKDFNAPKHSSLAVPNLQVIKAMQSLNSRGLIKTQFSWQHYYYTLTDEGIEYLREYLNLPPEIVPATFKKPVSAQVPRFGGRPEREGEFRRDRDEYRRRGDKEGASGDFKPEFRGGIGRGNPRN